MTPAQIEKWEAAAEIHADMIAGQDIAHPDWYPAYLTEFARLVSQDTQERHQRWICWQEWANTNDPPCHPSDKDWKPCARCGGPDFKPRAAAEKEAQS